MLLLTGLDLILNLGLGSDMSNTIALPLTLTFLPMIDIAIAIEKTFSEKLTLPLKLTKPSQKQLTLPLKLKSHNCY